MSTQAHKSDGRRTEPQRSTNHEGGPEGSQAIAVGHACAEPLRCRHVFAARCALNGQIDCLLESGWLTLKERRSYQRELRAAQSEEHAARVVQRAQITGHLRRIEKEANEQRRAQLRTDRAGYLRQHRAVAKALRAQNLQKRREREAARAEAQTSAEAPPSLSLASWVRVASAVLADLAPLCRAEVRPLLRLALDDPERARASCGAYRAARHEAESGAEDWALGCAESIAWAQLWGPRSASWGAILSSAASAHAGAAYQAVMSTHARSQADLRNRDLRADKARQAARAAAEARCAAWVKEARSAEAAAEAEQRKTFSASMRGADSLTQARAAHLLRVAEEPTGFAPHESCTGAKLGAWTRALRFLQQRGLVRDVGWRWVPTEEGAHIAARLRERNEARAWAQRQSEARPRVRRAAPAPGAATRCVCTLRRPQRAPRLQRRRVRPLRLRSAARRTLSCAPVCARRPAAQARRGHAPRRARGARRTLFLARGRDGPRAVGRAGRQGRTQSTRRGGRRSFMGSGA